MTAGNHTIAAPLTLNYDDTTVTVTPASSTLSVTDDLTATGRSITKAGAGAVQFQNVRAGGLTVDAGSVRIAPNGGPAGTSRVENLNISFGGRLDLADNDLVVDYSGASPIATVRTSIRAAYNSGDWTGDGIATSTGNAAQFGLGYAESGAVFTSFPATFSGQQVDDTSVLIAFARFGDANLDGVVNLNDFNRLAGNFGLSAAADGVADPTDWAALAAAVPEPLAGPAFALLAAGAGSGRRRRRRRRARAPAGSGGA